jgi:hypothetical protein
VTLGLLGIQRRMLPRPVAAPPALASGTPSPPRPAPSPDAVATVAGTDRERTTIASVPPPANDGFVAGIGRVRGAGGISIGGHSQGEIRPRFAGLIQGR